MANPALLNLKDIHLPNAINIWPLAPGWYLLVLLIALCSYLIYKFYSKRKIKRVALKMLKQQKKDYLLSLKPSTIISANISEILKRVALHYFTRDKVAHLQGEAWIKFLEKTSNHKINFYTVKEQLLLGPYSRQHNNDLELLFNKAKKWIKTCRDTNV